MKNSIRIMLIGLLYCTAVQCRSHSVALPMVDEAFIKDHYVSDEIANILDKQSEKLASLARKVHESPRQKHGVWTLRELPGYYVKYNVSRVTKCELLARVIEEEGLDLLHVPDKRLYHIKGRPYEFHSLNYVVVIKKVKDDRKEYRKRMNLEQVRQIITVIKESGHLSLYEPNHLRLSGGRISFIDTDGGFDKDKITVGIIRMFDRNLSHYYTPEALAYITDEIAKHLVRVKSKHHKNKWINDLGGFLGRQNTHMRRKIKALLVERINYYEEQLTQKERV